MHQEKKIPFLWLVLLQNTDITKIFNGKKINIKKKMFPNQKRKTIIKKKHTIT